MKWIGQAFIIQESTHGWLVWTELHPYIRGFSGTSPALAIANYKEQFRRHIKTGNK